jgi:D-alanine-D-alanine ligase
MKSPIITVFYGGTSSEREVSLGSGKACALGLTTSFPTRLVRIDTNALPEAIGNEPQIVISTLHGTFGEDGGMQGLLEKAGIIYAGCDAASSALTMDKSATKAACVKRGVKTAKSVTFQGAEKPTASHLVDALGQEVVIKPNSEGSSVGLSICSGIKEVEDALSPIKSGSWIAESRIRGRELSVGVLGGKAMGIVEITPKSGVYDFTSKYTKGMTQYQAPAPLEPAVTASVQAAAELAFAACGCRDYSRVDFILTEDNTPYLLEINTLPGMKETSLLPMSARCIGLDFTSLVQEMVKPALARYQAAHKTL